jgi:hypothetical protein
VVCSPSLACCDPKGFIMSTKIFTLATLCTVLVLGAAPARAQAHGSRGHGAFGLSRGPARAMIDSRAFVGPRRAILQPIVGGSPFSSAHYVLRPPVRVGYGLTVGYPVAFAGAYTSPYAYPYPYPYTYTGPYLAVGAARGSWIPGRYSFAVIGRVGARVTRGAARLAFRLLLP